MPRVKRGKSHVKRRKNLLAQTRGYRWRRKSSIKEAKTAIRKAGQHAFAARRTKKQVNRQLWQVKINAACRQNDISYSKFINSLKKAKIELDRKVLAELAVKNPVAFAKVVAQVKK